MTRSELLLKIKGDRISDDLYDFNGGHGHFDDQYLLNYNRGYWVIAFLERGKKRVLRKFISESDANDCFFETIKKASDFIKSS